MKHRPQYTSSEIAYIEARYAVTTTHVIARELNRSVHGIRSVIQRNGIRRRAKDKSAIYSGWSRKPKSVQAAR